VSVPHDAALPQLGALLDVEWMAPQLERSLGRPASIEQIAVARVAYKPGLRLRVHYEVIVDGGTENAVATALAGRDLAAIARRPALLELARRIDGRSPAVLPIVHEPAVDALLTWLPFDPRLPALAELRNHSLVAESYCPGSRIVLRQGERILKAYAKERSYERAVHGLRMAAESPLRTPELVECSPRLRLTAQTAVAGSAPTPEAAARLAGELVRRLQCAQLTPPRVVDADALLAMASDKAALVSCIVPELEPRLARLLERLRKTVPASDELRPAHGDFDADQLVETANGEHVVLDFDDACLAPAALDLATYLADVVVRGGEIETCRRLLLAGYGAEPPGLDWCAATVAVARAPQPFQRQAPDWPSGVDRIVRAAEELLQ
jgi:phosphotransferase family enzyme